MSPAGPTTRPTAQRMRQTIFDMLMHAPWGGRALLDGARVLDAFAGTGAMGLEAVSRGAASATFIDNDPAALSALRANVAACRAGECARVIACDMRAPPRGIRQDIIFLDPPYDLGLLPLALAALRATGWIAEGTLIVAETSRIEKLTTLGVTLAHRVHGAAQVNVWREL